ncbi:hypothetical protein ALC60_04431 [Trachymyrmex zeteki]|uniref:Uncharacterized protein n=1 Tax=Mycetomoellerius zeteki TaxID=64791 RepID=A0A151X8H7_9HYME|nr:hypothetical protein ALC60_04431 [Trachymyrmex zeteki]
MTRTVNLIDNFQAAQVQQQMPEVDSVANQVTVQRNSNIKLPRLNLPVFSGKCSEWMPFAQMFHTIISDDNNKLTDIEKFQYLRASLSGDAADSIESLDLTGENFVVAWRILSDRYDRIRIIVQAHVQAIIDIPSIKKESHSELKALINTTVKPMLKIKVRTNRTSAVTDFIRKSKKSLKIRLLLARTADTSDQLPTIDQFVEFLLKKCNTLESIINKKSASTSNNKGNQSSVRKSIINCAASVTSKCNFCDKNHFIYFCQSFLKLPNFRRLEERRNL